MSPASLLRWLSDWHSSRRQVAHTGGNYLEDCNEAETVANDAQVSSGVREWALDPGAASRLWETSVSLLDGV